MRLITRVALATISVMVLATQLAIATSGECSGIDVLYPKEGDSFSRAQQQTIYLILGNKLENATLNKVSAVRHKDGQTLVKEMRTSVDKDEVLSNIVVLQQDLEQLASALPDEFTFRITTKQHDGRECVYQSPSFEVTE